MAIVSMKKDDDLKEIQQSLNELKNQLAEITDTYEETDPEKADLLTTALDELDDVIDILAEAQE